MNLAHVILCFLIAGNSAFAVGDELLFDVEKKYARSKSIKAEVEKELYLSVLRKRKLSSGTLNMATEGKFRLEIKEPTQSLIVMNGKDIWVVEYPDPLFKEEKIQVLHSQFKDQLRSQVLLSFLMGQANLQKHFKIESKEENKKNVLYTLVPKEEVSDLKKVKMGIHPTEKTIQFISYIDGLDNEIKYKFKNKKFGSKTDKKLFIYTPPKNAEVSEIN